MPANFWWWISTYWHMADKYAMQIAPNSHLQHAINKGEESTREVTPLLEGLLSLILGHYFVPYFLFWNTITHPSHPTPPAWQRDGKMVVGSRHSSNPMQYQTMPAARRRRQNQDRHAVIFLCSIHSGRAFIINEIVERKWKTLPGEKGGKLWRCWVKDSLLCTKGGGCFSKGTGRFYMIRAIETAKEIV